MCRIIERVKGFFKTVFIFPIKIYQKVISPRKIPCCRFSPTCSEYAIQAIEIHGVFKGMALAIYRVLRCNPLCRGGYDPVPPKKKHR